MAAVDSQASKAEPSALQRAAGMGDGDVVFHQPVISREFWNNRESRFDLKLENIALEG